jgi:hypothetical protein
MALWIREFLRQFGAESKFSLLFLPSLADQSYTVVLQRASNGPNVEVVWLDGAAGPEEARGR